MSRPALLLALGVIMATMPAAPATVPVTLLDQGNPVWTSASDGFYAYLPEFGSWPGLTGGTSRAIVVSPEGYALEIRYDPPRTRITGGADAVVHVGMDLSIDARLATNASKSIPDTWFRVRSYDVNSPQPPQQNLVGVRADGTWLVINSLKPQLLLHSGASEPTNQVRPLGVGGVQLHVADKVFDDVWDRPLLQSEPIDTSGTGEYAGELTPYKAWNWHAQTAPRYDTGPNPAENVLNPEQAPRLWRFHSDSVRDVTNDHFASATDAFFAHVVPGSSASVTAPDGRQLIVTHQLGDACLSETINAWQGTTCTDPAIIRVQFDGSLNAWRPHSMDVVAADRFIVEGDLTGAPLDGTWRVDAGKNRLGFPAGIRVEAGGKAFDHVHSDSEPIQSGGSGLDAADHSSSIKFWNWHNQAQDTEYHTKARTPTTPEECPTQAKTVIETSLTCALVLNAPVDDEAFDDLPTDRPIRTRSEDGTLVAYVDEDNNAERDAGEPHALVGPSPSLDVVETALWGGATTPQNGTTQTYFTFKVNYRGLPPRAVYLVVTDSYANALDVAHHPYQTNPRYHLMTSSSANALNGAEYTYGTRLKLGSHQYHFEAIDPLLGLIRYPEVGDLTGPRVEN